MSHYKISETNTEWPYYFLHLKSSYRHNFNFVNARILKSTGVRFTADQSIICSLQRRPD